MPSLAAMFLAARSRPHASASAAAIEEALRTVWDEARAAWPRIELGPERFVPYLAERLPSELDEIAAVRTLQADDLYLACACFHGDRTALVLFEHELIDDVVALMTRRKLLVLSPDDFKQLLCERLLTAPDGEEPRIGGYSGRGPLRAWLRTAAVRAAINARRGSRPTEDLDGPEALAATMVVPDPEMALFKSQHHAAFRETFAAALSALLPEERNLLRFRFLQGVTQDAIARMQGVSKRTVHRQIERLRQHLLEDTRQRLARRLDIRPEELGTLMRVLQSQLASAIQDALGRTKKE